MWIRPARVQCGWAVAILTGIPTATFAQDINQPPAVIEIFREVLKPGHMAAHAITEAGWPRAFARANIPTHYLGMIKETGSGEAWFMAAHPSLGNIDVIGRMIQQAPDLADELDRLSAADGEHLLDYQRIVARLQPGMTYWNNHDLSRSRYFQVITYVVKPGRDAVLTEAAEMFMGLAKEAKAPTAWATYQVLAGMTGGTYLILVPFDQMEDLDTTSPVNVAMAKVMTPEAQRRFAAMAADAYVSVTTHYLRFTPRLSHVAPEFAAGDPGFWQVVPPGGGGNQ